LFSYSVGTHQHSPLFFFKINLGNGGTFSSHPKIANVPIDASVFPQLVEFALKNNVGLCIAGPEQPLVDGISEHFKKGKS